MISREELEKIIYDDNDMYPDKHDLALDMRKLMDRIDELETDLLIAHSYADSLINQLKGDFLPKDIENLRNANGKFAEENCELKQFILDLFRDFDFDNPNRTFETLALAYDKYKLGNS